MKPDFTKGGGLVPVITQEYGSNTVLMLAWINETAWSETCRTGLAHYWSRSRNRLWKKGESSGNMQRIIEIRIDCDADSVLYIVDQQGGAACHEGYTSCFFRSLGTGHAEPVIVEKRLFDPEDVYGK